MHVDDFQRKRTELNEKFKQNFYYLIIFTISFVVLVFLPMIGSEAGLEFNIPTTPAGWAIYIFTKVLIATLNVMIFFSFMQQAKLNVRNDVKYKAGCEILGKYKDKRYIPRSPHQWERSKYLKKGITIFFSTAASLVALANAFLTYDYMSLLTYIMVIVIGVVFGLLAMSDAENYWTGEFYDYAMMIKKENEPQICPTIDFEQNPHNLSTETQKSITGEISGSKLENKENNTNGNTN